MQGDELPPEGYAVQLIDDIAYYYGDKSGVSVTYEILKPGTSDYAPLSNGGFVIRNNADEWPGGQYTVRQTLTDPSGTSRIHGYSYFEVKRKDNDAHVHNWEEQIDKEPTCIEEGHLIKNCTICGETGEEVIPPAGHRRGEWSKDEINHWHECTVCSAKLDIASHEFGDWIVDAETTEESDGSSHRVCSICGYTELKVSKAGKNSQTGRLRR